MYKSVYKCIQVFTSVYKYIQGYTSIYKYTNICVFISVLHVSLSTLSTNGIYGHDTNNASWIESL